MILFCGCPMPIDAHAGLSPLNASGWAFPATGPLLASSRCPQEGPGKDISLGSALPLAVLKTPRENFHRRVLVTPVRRCSLNICSHTCQLQREAPVTQLELLIFNYYYYFLAPIKKQMKGTEGVAIQARRQRKSEASELAPCGCP